ncbi:ML domain-containing protein [Geopyxis carbonaria]|nr:ML domain-containing protein [Geopyxis carbonaria]
MNIYTLYALLTFCGSTSAGSFFQQAAGLSDLLDTSQSYPVPGNSPMEFCGDYSNDIIDIKDLTIVPNPPVKGESLTIQATGMLKEKITAGAFVQITVKYGLITLVRQVFDLCENADQVDLECPVDAGEKILKKTVDIPSQIPPGVYTVMGDAYTVDQTPITCLTAKVQF